MSLGCRTIKRGGIKSAASLVSRPSETLPLYFLYPRWFRFSSTGSQAIAIDKDIYRTPPNSRKTLATSRKSSSAKGSDTPRWSSTNTTTDEHQRQDAARHEQSTEAWKHEVGTAADPSEASNHENSSLVEWSPNVPDLRNAKDEDTITAGTTDAEHLDGRSSGDATNSWNSELKVRYSTTKSTLAHVESLVAQILKNAIGVEVHEQNKQLDREEYYVDRNVKARGWNPEWQSILAALRNTTPHHGEWYSRLIQITIEPSDTKRLMTAPDDNIWDIANQYDCSVAIGSYPGPDSPATFLLSGSRAAITRTIADVFHIAPDCRIMKAQKTSGQLLNSASTSTDVALNAKPVQVRFTAASGKVVYPPKMSDGIDRPSSWTQDTLLAYVKALISTPFPPFLEKEQHMRAMDLQKTLLYDLFKDPDPSRKEATTRAAFHEAIRFFMKLGNFKQVRALFVRMEMHNIQATPATFVLMLQGVARLKDLQNFHYILHLMLRRNLRPNGDIWLTYLMALESFYTRVAVAKQMKGLGLLAHPTTAKGVAQVLVEEEILHFIDEDRDLDAFLQHMDTRYGALWLNLESGSKVIDALGRRGLISRCLEMLYAMDSRFIKVDLYAINIILYHCRQHHNHSGAVTLLQKVLPAWKFKPDQETFRNLWLMAYDYRCYNMAKVVWKYACLTGRTTESMRQKIRKDWRDAWASLPGESIWKWAYPSVILNVDNPANHTSLMISEFRDAALKRERMKPEPTQHTLYTPVPKPEGEPSIDDLERRRKYREAMVDTFILEFQMPDTSQYRIMRKFEDMLSVAYQMDMEWKEAQVWKHKDTEWLRKSAIRVPIIVKENGMSMVLQL